MKLGAYRPCNTRYRRRSTNDYELTELLRFGSILLSAANVVVRPELLVGAGGFDFHFLSR